MAVRLESSRMIIRPCPRDVNLQEIATLIGSRWNYNPLAGPQAGETPLVFSTLLR
jgi:hypothetical protein